MRTRGQLRNRSFFRFEPTKQLRQTVEHAALLLQQSRLNISEDDPESHQLLDRAQFANVCTYFMLATLWTAYGFTCVFSVTAAVQSYCMLCTLCVALKIPQIFSLLNSKIYATTVVVTIKKDSPKLYIHCRDCCDLRITSLVSIKKNSSKLHILFIKYFDLRITSHLYFCCGLKIYQSWWLDDSLRYNSFFLFLQDPLRKYRASWCLIPP